MRLFVLFSYFTGEIKDKDSGRDAAYEAFLDGNFAQYPKAYNYLKYLYSLNENKEIKDQLNKTEIIILKGGAFKIKNYFMETGNIMEMRGASALLSFVTEKMVPQKIREKAIDESIIYIGASNVFAILKYEEGLDGFSLELEQIFDKYTITAENAFVCEKTNLYELIANYKRVIRGIEIKLEDRKKIKIYNTLMVNSNFYNSEIKISEDEIARLNNGVIEKTGNQCKSCSVRYSSYEVEFTGEPLCGSCLQKYKVGQVVKKGYYKKAADYAAMDMNIKTGSIKNLFSFADKASESIKLEDIQDSNGDIAILYGDGNNFGKIVQSMNSIYEMMYFSRISNLAAETATYKAILMHCFDNTMKKFHPFEIIALGGDDIFFIVPADKGIYISRDLIESFNFFFQDNVKNEYKATMSIGIFIGKCNYPIRSAFEIADQELKHAKKIEKELRQQKRNCGSIGLVTLNGAAKSQESSVEKNSILGAKKEVKYSLSPMSLKTLEGLIKLIEGMKDGYYKIGKSRLYNIQSAFEASSCLEEYKLFFLYYDNKDNKRKRLISKHFERNNENLIEGYIFKDGLLESCDGNETVIPWDDIVCFWNYLGSGEGIEND